MNKKFGQISIPIALALGGAGSIITGLSAYYGSQIHQKEEIAMVRQDVAVLVAQKNNIESNVSGLEMKLDRVENKLDALLVNRGINPEQISLGISKNQ